MNDPENAVARLAFLPEPRTVVTRDDIRICLVYAQGCSNSAFGDASGDICRLDDSECGCLDVAHEILALFNSLNDTKGRL